MLSTPILKFLCNVFPNSFYFLVEEDSAPVAITVTPCAAELEWTLSLMDLPEDGSGSSTYTAVHHVIFLRSGLIVKCLRFPLPDSPSFLRRFNVNFDT